MEVWNGKRKEKKTTEDEDDLPDSELDVCPTNHSRIDLVLSVQSFEGYRGAIKQHRPIATSTQGEQSERGQSSLRKSHELRPLLSSLSPSSLPSSFLIAIEQGTGLDLLSLEVVDLVPPHLLWQIVSPPRFYRTDVPT